MSAFRFAWVAANDCAFNLSPFSYFNPKAAVLAAPTVNFARARIGLPPVTHVAEFQDEQLVAVRPLREVA